MAIVLSLVVTRRVLAEFVAAVVALKKKASLESLIRNARERRAALRLILMRPSRAVLSAIFSRDRTLQEKREREREVESSGSATKGISILNPIGGYAQPFHLHRDDYERAESFSPSFLRGPVPNWFALSVFSHSSLSWPIQLAADIDERFVMIVVVNGSI